MNWSWLRTLGLGAGGVSRLGRYLLVGVGFGFGIYRKGLVARWEVGGRSHDEYTRFFGSVGRRGVDEKRARCEVVDRVLEYCRVDARAVIDPDRPPKQSSDRSTVLDMLTVCIVSRVSRVVT